jgi:hypothetical protein
VRSVKQECLSKLILFGEGSLRRALSEFTTIITPRKITRARETSYSSPRRQRVGATEQYAVESDSAVCFDTTVEPHQYFDPTATRQGDFRAYIAAQQERHRKTSFQFEFLALLHKHDLEAPAKDYWT